jgi:AcrR family transcriptional regulator
MAPRKSVNRKRLGRPPATDSADTRRRILDIARTSFAAVGYASSTNRDLAAQMDLTAGAIYHYFGSKLDLYVAVYEDVQQRIYGDFNAATDRAEGFIGKFEAVLDAAHALNREDPSLAAFVGIVRTDMRQHAEIRERLGETSARRAEFFVRLVDAGIANGEISKRNRPLVIEFIGLILIGLTDGVSDDSERHERAITSIKMALRGVLISPSPTPPLELGAKN